MDGFRWSLIGRETRNKSVYIYIYSITDTKYLYIDRCHQIEIMYGVINLHTWIFSSTLCRGLLLSPSACPVIWSRDCCLIRRGIQHKCKTKKHTWPGELNWSWPPQRNMAKPQRAHMIHSFSSTARRQRRSMFTTQWWSKHHNFRQPQGTKVQSGTYQSRYRNMGDNQTRWSIPTT